MEASLDGSTLTVNEVREQYRAMRLLHGALLASVALYVVAGLLLRHYLFRPASGLVNLPGASDWLLFVLLVVATTVIFVLVYSGRLDNLNRNDARVERRIPPPAVRLRDLRAACILRFALLEAPALIGFVLFLLNGELLPLLLFPAASFLSLLLHGPDAARWKEVERQVTSALL